MWTYKRFFTYIVLCGFLLGSVYFIHLQVSYIEKRPTPDFFPNAARYRTSRVCANRVLILVNSTPTGSGRRQVIRETWGHPSVTQTRDISIAFGVGAAGNIDVQRSLDWEAEVYGDIFQSADIDSGAKSASKVIEMLKTTRSACAPLPEFVLKTEDDVFLNTLFLEEFLENIETYSSSNTMWCLEWNRKFDTLGNTSTWIVPKFDKNYDSHPNYCIGTVYLMTGRALDAMIRRHDAQTSRTQLPEDVYVTGVLAKEAGITLSLLGDRFKYDDIEEIDVEKVAYARFEDTVEDSTKKIWKVFVKDKFNESRQSDSGL